MLLRGSLLISGFTLTSLPKAKQRLDGLVNGITERIDRAGQLRRAAAHRANAVSQMDRATQQNAELVDESAAAAESLKSQALQPVQAVAMLKQTP